MLKPRPEFPWSGYRGNKENQPHSEQNPLYLLHRSHFLQSFHNKSWFYSEIKAVLPAEGEEMLEGQFLVFV